MLHDLLAHAACQGACQGATLGQVGFPGMCKAALHHAIQRLAVRSCTLGP